MSKLAMFGGKKSKTTPFGTGKRYGEEELAQLKEAIEQNTLFYWQGKKVKELCAKFADMYGMKHCVATSSGSAAIHAALGGMGVTEGDEVITTPLTDFGTVIGILFQNAIPIFADINPNTYNIDPKSIEEKITDKTKVILVVHLAGNPADMDPIMDIAKKYNLKVLEDCAQSYLCCYKGRLAGTIGDVSCFSLNEFKQISAGDGGMVLTNNDDFYTNIFRFADKNYNRFGSYADARECDYIAPNYRMSELVGAVGLAQLEKLSYICSRRNAWGDKITEGIKHLKGIYPHKVESGNKSSYNYYMFRVDAEEAGVDAKSFSEALNAEGIPVNYGYIGKCLYERRLFQKKQGYLGTHAPFDSKYYGREIEYKKGLCPEAEKVLKTGISFNINEFYTEQDINEIIEAIVKIAVYYQENRGV